ncbi:MAG TPA: ABC transporter permease [Thermoleophilaceae bacterium]|nr:ABC transporter permease [Thermoleophilaceae bacterium]
MSRLVLAELLKLRTTRTFWALTGSAIGLVLLILVLTLALDHGLDTADDVRSFLSSVGIYGLLALVLGVVTGAGEYRHGTIASTLLVTPQRLRAVSATVMACFLGGLAIGIVAGGLTAAISLPWLSAKGAVMLPAGETLKIFLGGALYAALAAALGAALGALLRNQVAAVVIVLVSIFVIDPTISALLEHVGQFTLTGLGIAMSGAHQETDLLPFGVAALVWALYTLLLAALAAIFTARRDI